VIDWNVTGTINLVEVADLIVASVGVGVSLFNLKAARWRVREWIASGQNGPVLIAARTAVRHEAMRVGAQLCFVVAALAAFQVGGGAGAPVVTLHLALLVAMSLVMAMSVSSMVSRRAIEREVAKPWDGVDRRKWDGIERRTPRPPEEGTH
jgi:hypothetical protein